MYNTGLKIIYLLFFGIKNLCYMSHLQILTCPVHTILEALTETQNLYSQLITLVKMSSQDIYNIYTEPT